MRALQVMAEEQASRRQRSEAAPPALDSRDVSGANGHQAVPDIPPPVQPPMSDSPYAPHGHQAVPGIAPPVQPPMSPHSDDFDGPGEQWPVIRDGDPYDVDVQEAIGEGDVVLTTAADMKQVAEESLFSSRFSNGKAFLWHRSPQFTEQHGGVMELPHLEACTSHQYRRWVVAKLSAEGLDDERALVNFASAQGFADLPFVLGLSADGGHAYVVYRCREEHKRRVKKLTSGSPAMLTFMKGGSQNARIVETVAALSSGCRLVLASLFVVEEAKEESSRLLFNEALDRIEDWGVAKLTAYIEDARIKKSRDEKLETLEHTCLVSQRALLEAVAMRAEAAEFVFTLGSQHQQRACPKVFDEGATAAAKEMSVFVWNPDAAPPTFRQLTCKEWLDTEEHLLSTLLLLGPGSLGKSKLQHMLAQELTIAYQRDFYIFAKAIDPLGVLSHKGFLRKAAVLLLADCDFRTSKGKLTAEGVKAIFDICEGGTIQETRYQPATFPGNGELCRIISVNGAGVAMGAFFRKYSMDGLADVVEALAQPDGVGAAGEKVKVLDADGQAQIRRFAICICKERLVNTEMVQALRADARAKALAGKRRREDYHMS